MRNTVYCSDCGGEYYPLGTCGESKQRHCQPCCKAHSSGLKSPWRPSALPSYKGFEVFFDPKSKTWTARRYVLTQASGAPSKREAIHRMRSIVKTAMVTTRGESP